MGMLPSAIIDEYVARRSPRFKHPAADVPSQSASISVHKLSNIRGGYLLGTVTKRIVVFAGLLGAPVATNPGQPVPAQPLSTIDPRLVRLKQFLIERDCPIRQYAEEFIQVADQNDLDWRLLPSISFVESSGGKAYRNNNVFGWNSCRGRRFSSIRAGIHFVADKLANSEPYKEKTVDEKLRIYNSRVEYRKLVRSVMASISATEYPLTLDPVEAVPD
jgi:hypothetical protein